MKNILIIGMGDFGQYLAYRLTQLHHQVCIVDSDANIINILANEFPNAYTGDCMQIITLKELGVQNFDICIVAIGDNFQASLEITSNLKELGAQYIITKSSSDIQSKFLTMAGADDVVYPDKDIAEKIAVRCNATNLFDYIQISNQYSIFEIKVKKSWVGRSIKELDVRNKYDINIIAISNKGVVSMPTPTYTFYEGDHVYLFGKDNVIKKLKD